MKSTVKLNRLWHLVILLMLTMLAGCGPDFKPVPKDDIVPFKRVLFPTASDSVITSIERYYDAKGNFIGSHTYQFDEKDRLLVDIDSLPGGKVSGWVLNYGDDGNPSLQYAFQSDTLSDGLFSYRRDKRLYEIHYTTDRSEGGYPKSTYTYGNFRGGEERPVKRTDAKNADDNDPDIIEYRYSENIGKPVLSGLTETRGRDVKEITYADDGKTIKEVQVSRYNKKRTKLNPVEKYTYEYETDSLGHWVKANIFRSNGKLYQTIKREYTTPESMLAAKTAKLNEKYTNIKSGALPTNYWNSIRYRFELVNAKSNAPSWVLYLIILGFMAVYMWIAIKWLLKNTETLDKWRPYRRGKMERLWMFNKEPYINALIITGCLIASFLAAIITMILIGLVTYGILWIFKLLLIVLVWVGWISLILAIICFFGAWIGTIIFGIIAALILLNREAIAKFGQAAVDWGFDFMHKLNLYDWTLNIFKDLWDVIVIFLFAPVITFLCIALIMIIFMGILMGIEWLVMKIYDIRRPCPSCGSTKGFEYLANNYNVHPVGLHPGIYGIFHQTNPATGRRLPTMIFNGKAKIKRRCKNCKNLEEHIGNKSFGTEKHVGIVGHRSSGKTYFLYSELDLITNSTKAEQTDATPDTSIKAVAERIKKGANVQTDQRQWFKAIQLMLPRKMVKVPWHLFFYDVAGENFDTNVSRTPTALEFYKNVESIVFIIDPSMVDPLMPGVSPKAKAWIKARNESEHSSPASTYARLTAILEEHGRKLKNINFYFLLTKSDLGYLDGKGAREYIEEELGLSETVNQAVNKFRNVGFGATTVKNAKNPKILKEVLSKLGVDL